MNPNKSFTDLKMKQREKISEWLYEETNKYYKQYSRMPGKSQREAILFSVYEIKFKVQKYGYLIKK